MAKFSQVMDDAIFEGRRVQDYEKLRQVDRRTQLLKVDQEKRRVDRRAIDRRNKGVDRRVTGRRETDPNVDELVNRLNQQKHKKAMKSDNYHAVLMVIVFLLGIIVSQMVNFYMNENLLSLMLIHCSHCRRSWCRS